MTRRGVRTRIAGAFAATVLAALTVPATPAAGDHGEGNKFVAWLLPNTTISYDSTGEWCMVRARFGMQEFGKHGVTQFKYRMRAYDHENYVAQDFFAGVIKTWGWYATTTFPNDPLSYRIVPGIDARFSVAPTASGLKPSAVFRVKAVGVRPSLWARDYRAWLTIGSCSYEVSLGS